MLKSWKTTVAGLMTATGDPTTNGWVGIGVTTWVWNSTDSVTKQTGDNTVLSKDYSATGTPFTAGAKYVIRPATYYGGTNGVVQFGIGGNYGRYFYIYILWRGDGGKYFCMVCSNCRSRWKIICRNR